MQNNIGSLILTVLLLFAAPFLVVAPFAVLFLMARSRLRRRRQASETAYESVLFGSKPSLPIWLVRIVAFLLVAGMLIGFLLLVAWYGKQVGFDNWAYLAAVVVPLLCSIPASAIFLVAVYRRARAGR